MEKFTTAFNAAFNSTTPKKPVFGDEEKALLDVLQQIADELTADGVFKANLSAGMAKDGNYVALELTHIESRCQEVFHIGFSQVSFSRSIKVTTGATRHPFGQNGPNEISRAESGYCIQFSNDLNKFLRHMGAHMAAKVDARRHAASAASYVTDKKRNTR